MYSSTGENVIKLQNPQLILVESLTVADGRDEQISRLEDDKEAMDTESE